MCIEYLIVAILSILLVCFYLYAIYILFKIL